MSAYFLSVNISLSLFFILYKYISYIFDLKSTDKNLNFCDKKK